MEVWQTMAGREQGLAEHKAVEMRQTVAGRE